MKSKIILFNLLFISVIIFPQNKQEIKDADFWRKKGFSLKQDGQITEAVNAYKEILKINPDDYDAKLAIANMYYNLKDYKSSLEYYGKIYEKDKSDVEALLGFGRNYLRLDSLNKSAHYFNKAISNIPEYIPPYFDLAKVYEAKGKLDSAKIVYKNIMNYDSTYSEAWAGIGKVYYWQNQPLTAIPFYEKAIQLDPTNIKIKEQYENVLRELQFNVTGKFRYVTEEEEEYKIDALIQQYEINKRLNDNFQIDAAFLLDYSQRKFSIQKQQNKRWFDNSRIQISYINNNHRIRGFIGASINDSTITSYGINYLAKFNFGNVSLTNSFTAAYDYFYYWNKVGQDFISDNIKISFKNLTLDATYKSAVVRNNYIWDFYTKDENPNLFYNVGLKYKFLSAPDLTISVNQTYLDFKYNSPLYYSPYERLLRGISLTGFHSFGKIYSYLNYTYRFGNYDINNWNVEAEIGYSLSNFSVSIGGSYFDDPYYTSSNLFLAVKGIF